MLAKDGSKFRSENNPKRRKNDPKRSKNNPKSFKNGPKRLKTIQNNSKRSKTKETADFFKTTSTAGRWCRGSCRRCGATAAAVAATGPKEPSFIGAIFSKPPLAGWRQPRCMPPALWRHRSRRHRRCGWRRLKPMGRFGCLF